MKRFKKQKQTKKSKSKSDFWKLEITFKLKKKKNSNGQKQAKGLSFLRMYINGFKYIRRRRRNQKLEKTVI